MAILCVTQSGKTFSHFYTRVAELIEIFKLTLKHFENIKQSAMYHHLLQC